MSGAHTRCAGSEDIHPDLLMRDDDNKSRILPLEVAVLTCELLHYFGPPYYTIPADFDNLAINIIGQAD